MHKYERLKKVLLYVVLKSKNAKTNPPNADMTKTKGTKTITTIKVFLRARP